MLHLSDNSSIETDKVILATPAFSASEMLKDIDKNLSSTLGKIFYPAVSVVCFGYKREKIKHSLNGFGFLIPFREGLKILGTLWDSSVFPNRAPEGYVLLRSMLGGARNSEFALQNEDKLIASVRAELKEIMGIDVTPDFIKVYTHPKGIPQYSVGHSEKLQKIYEISNKYKGLYITGNAYKGIGVNDCIENSYKLAEKIVKEI
jgi:oxygen-dependent protoporphyrinogen oxidase